MGGFLAAHFFMHLAFSDMFLPTDCRLRTVVVVVAGYNQLLDDTALFRKGSFQERAIA